MINYILSCLGFIEYCDKCQRYFNSKKEGIYMGESYLSFFVCIDCYRENYKYKPAFAHLLESECQVIG
jgi:hypothetical protein